ncbi:MAG TPA: phosphatase PAP2 family protein, partial [Solirubrobacteraceae bacterium]
LLGGLALARRLGPRYAVLLAAAAAVVVLTSALKAVLGPTPLWVEWFGAKDVNFPSGHAAYAASAFGFVVVVARAAGWLEVAAAAGMVIGGMGPAALLARSHLPSDILAGYALGTAWLLVLLVYGLPWASGAPAPRPPARRRARP